MRKGREGALLATKSRARRRGRSATTPVGGAWGAPPCPTPGAGPLRSLRGGRAAGGAAVPSGGGGGGGGGWVGRVDRGVPPAAPPAPVGQPRAAGAAHGEREGRQGGRGDRGQPRKAPPGRERGPRRAEDGQG